MSNKNALRRQKKKHANKVARNSRREARKAQGTAGFKNRKYATRKRQEEMRTLAQVTAMLVAGKG